MGNSLIFSSKFMHRFSQYARVCLGAIGFSLAFPDANAWYLLIPALAFFISAVDRVKTSRALWYTCIFSTIFWFYHVEWVRIATGGWLPWVALALTQIIAWVLWAWMASVCRIWKWTHTVWGESILLSVTWVGIEQLRSRFPFGGFPWANLAYAQVDSPLGHLAPIGGEVLVSLSVVIIAVLLRRSFRWSDTNSDIISFLHSPHIITRAVSFLCAVLFFSIPSTFSLPITAQAGELRVASIQGNVEIPGNTTFSIPLKVTRNHIRETRSFIDDGKSVDLILWGENSADIDPNIHRGTAREIGNIVDMAGVPILVGYNEYIGKYRFNWVQLWEPKKGFINVKYGKQHPVPFGEYIPWRSLVGSLAAESAQVDVDMLGANNPAYLEFPLRDGRLVPVSIGICFEVAYESIIHDGIMRGGQVIVIPTNNYHFRYSAESTQQAQMLRFRAMEYSRAATQTSTNGVSMLIAPDGSIISQTDKQTADYLVASLPLRTSFTLAAQCGSILGYLIICLSVVLTLGSCTAFFIEKKRSKNV